MNTAIAAGIGALLAAVSAIGGVSVYQGEPEGVSSTQLYTYADK